VPLFETRVYAFYTSIGVFALSLACYPQHLEHLEQWVMDSLGSLGWAEANVEGKCTNWQVKS